ncbi:unnamed protein product [Clonostachys rosea f. rosea IK726]|uniref:Uncharacterized protein n=2 Tax=Bionectria ochroleuca TaxID=29856 RepID=A0A0B7JTC6_BIOOC|nr:unnamed protein product [Clonostachys rosea f. rosea IK726]
MAVMDLVGKDGSLGQEGAARASTLVTREKPFTISNLTITIALSVTIPIVVILVVLAVLYRRNLKRQRLEDAKDSHRDLDFGLGDTPMVDGKKKSRKSFLMGGDKNNHRNNQLSMDMNLSSPYLLPPQVQASHDSLARDYSKEYDPYQIVNSEVGSIKSFGKESHHRSGPIRQGSFPKSSLSSHEKSNPFASPAAPEPVHRSSTPSDPTGPIHPIKPQVAEMGDVNGFEPQQTPNIQEPPPAVSKNPMDRIASPPIDDKFDFGLPPSDNHNAGTKSPTNSGGLGIDLNLPQPLSPIDDLMFTTANSSPQPDVSSPQPAQTLAQPTTATPGARESQGSFYDDQPQNQTTDYYEDYSDYGRGRPTSRQSLEHHAQPQPRQQPGGLGVPQQESKRLSVGFRPLPPADDLDSEDPEYRANRIRSFYKEYFDDSKETAPPVPGVPAQHSGPSAQYYEDYDGRYLGETAFFDPDSNAFVMPYAQPVHRRAMTPPPAGRRGPPGPGPRGAPRSASRGPGPRPHGPHGSLGGMSLPGGPRSQSAWGPRPGSSASRQGRNLPPPAALKTLPTPSKLTDDSFALMNATDFAPPDAFSERARGRSQSPLGERRPYQPKVPAVSPLVNSYDELNALPSPHLLRKSSTFTGLDFLPPKKFKDGDSMSDAGSIRSNRSGLSAQAAHAIRSGAGRISRLPGDQVFTQQALASELKPQWGMRQ